MHGGPITSSVEGHEKDALSVDGHTRESDLPRERTGLVVTTLHVVPPSKESTMLWAFIQTVLSRHSD